MRMQGWQKTINRLNTPGPALAATALAGMALGYFSQANWAIENHEALAWGRVLLGMLAAGVLYPALVLAWTRLWSALLNLDFGRASRQTIPLCAGVALVMFFPAQILTGNGVLAGCVLLSFAATLLPLFLERDLSPAHLLCLGLLAMLCVELHDISMKYYDVVNIERGLKGDAQALFRYRVLVHFLSGWLGAILQAAPQAMAVLIRALATFAIFIISIRVCKIWFRPLTAMAAPLVHLVMLPFSYMFLYVTDEVEVLGAWCLLWAVARQRHFWALLCMLFFTINRELLIFLGPWYFVYTGLNSGWSLKSPAWRYSALMVIGVLAVHFLLILAMGFSYHDNGAFYRFLNAQYVSAWLEYLSPARHWTWNATAMSEVLKFAGGVWIAALIFYRRLPRVISLGILICLPFFWFLQAIHGGFLECRELYPLLPFMVCALLAFAEQSVMAKPGQDSGRASA